MLVLDTDHLVEFDEASDAGGRLKERLLAADDEVAATIIFVEEQFRGWAAQIPAYARQKRRLEFYAGWNVLAWDAGSARNFVDFRRQAECPQPYRSHHRHQPARPRAALGWRSAPSERLLT